MTAAVRPIITDRALPAGNRVVLREQPGGYVQVFVHRPALLADPEGVVRELLHCADVNRRACSAVWEHAQAS